MKMPSMAITGEVRSLLISIFANTETLLVTLILKWMMLLDFTFTIFHCHT